MKIADQFHESYVDWPPLILRHTYYMAEFEPLLQIWA